MSRGGLLFWLQKAVSRVSGGPLAAFLARRHSDEGNGLETALCGFLGRYPMGYPGLIKLSLRLEIGCYHLPFGHLQEKKIRALAVATRARLPDLPDVPTMIESGFPDFF